MKTDNDYGKCDVCNKQLEPHFYSFERQVEQARYDREDGQTEIKVLRSETIASYCSAKCAWASIIPGLAERGIKRTGGGEGPIEVCAKCDGLVDMTQPHINYSYFDQTLDVKPWLTSIEVHYAEGLAVVCVRCDGDVAADEMNLMEPVESGDVPAPCECHDGGPSEYDTTDLGVDTTDNRYGEVELRVCRKCGGRWLKYFVEYESFTASGRWFYGLLPEVLPMPLTAENAVPILNSLPWHIYGGSRFNLPPPGRRDSGDVYLGL